MNFKTHNEDETIDCCGTSLMGHIDAGYSELIEAFGNSSEYFDNYKSDAEWMVRFDDGTEVTIYNYKDGKNYCGASGLPRTEIRDWHVGGHSKKAVELIKQVLKK